MHLSAQGRRARWLLCLAFVAGIFVAGIFVAGCGEDMSEPKVMTPEDTPKNKAADSQKFFFQNKQSSKKGTRK